MVMGCMIYVYKCNRCGYTFSTLSKIPPRCGSCGINHGFKLLHFYDKKGNKCVNWTK